jgi:hypothetical protein
MARRARVRRAARNRCQHCGAPPPLELHHRDGNPANDRLDNLRLLCVDCHLEATHEQRKGAAASSNDRPAPQR